MTDAVLATTIRFPLSNRKDVAERKIRMESGILGSRPINLAYFVSPITAGRLHFQKEEYEDGGDSRERNIQIWSIETSKRLEWVGG